MPAALLDEDRWRSGAGNAKQNRNTRNETMAVVTSPFVLLPAVVGLIALTQTVGDAALKADDQATLPTLSDTVSDAVSDVTGSVPAAVREAFTCLQLQVIDETELIADMPADGDCG
jgi:hypothetical protein